MIIEGETGGSTPESSPSSPLGLGHPVANAHPLAGNVALAEAETSPSAYNQHLLTHQGSISDLTLYTSPSLPNISLGRPAMAANGPVSRRSFNTFFLFLLFFSFPSFPVGSVRV